MPKGTSGGLPRRDADLVDGRRRQPCALRTFCAQRGAPTTRLPTSIPRGRLPAVRTFIVVAKNRRDLYEYFSAGFADVADVNVILDRRLGPDDPPRPLPGADDRRTPLDIYDELESRGFVIVRLPS